MKKRTVTERDKVESTKSPGAFLADGRFKEDGWESERGQADRIVRELVKERRKGGLTPARAALVVQAASVTEAFPNAIQWAAVASWWAAWMTTAAEAAVVYEGRGANGHPCGERFASGSEADCLAPEHRVRLGREQVQKVLGDLMRQLSAPAVTVYQEEPCDAFDA